jgi:hypothetical protein
MLRLDLVGVDSLLLSPLCRRCPQGRAGCCAAPPAVAWADIGRIVRLGGRDFLLCEVQEGRLVPSPRGLSIRRVPASDGFPARCTYLGPGDRGCVLEPHQRSATCNYYLCEDAFVLAEEERDPLVAPARKAHDRIADLLGACDIELSALVQERFPEGPSWDAAFFDWIAAEFEKLLLTP